MTEHLQAAGTEPRSSRRRRLLALSGIALMGASGRQLERGISLNPPLLEVEDMFVNRTAEGIQLFSMNTLEEDGSESILTLLTPEGRLLYEPSGEFFDADKPMNYVHRGGNSPASIDESLRKVIEEEKEGSIVLDLDANVVNGTVYGEHGIIPQVERRLGRRSLYLYLPAVFDINEMEVKFEMPNTYEELVSYIADLSRTSGRTFAVSAELKRGEFNIDVLHEMFTIHQRHKVPALMHSPNPHQFDAIGEEIASAQE